MALLSVELCLLSIELYASWGAISGELLGKQEPEILERLTYLEVEDDGPDESQGKFDIPINDVHISNVD